ncbi:MAG TPA: hypothetical protein VGU20_01085 [Stellaceae bacterium]|nr:hypothetical protein [Stellaceae bacterium]
MKKNVRICVNQSGRFRSLAWISFQKDGSISVGFADNSISVQDTQQANAPRTLVNPHFTFHPPAWWHLRSEGEEAMWRGLVWTKHLPDADCSPWLRFVSKPVNDLPIFKRVSHGKQAGIWALPVSESCSVGLMVDFVNSVPSAANDATAKFMPWHDVTLRFRARPLPPQQSALGYEIMG